MGYINYLVFLILVPNSSALVCLNGSVSVTGGEVSFLPVQQSFTNSNFCFSSYANNGDMVSLNQGPDLGNFCQTPGCYVDNSSIFYDKNICCCSTDLCNNLTTNKPIRRTFPSDFMFGVATAAYQIEGGAYADGKGPSIWDIWTPLPGSTSDNSTGEVACNSYEKYAEDIANAKHLGLNHYRFGISWPRILPTGKIDSPNELGLLYYDKLINLTLASGIEPMVTLFHWDMPQSLMDIGGFLNPYIKNYFANYSRLVFQRYGDRVKKWMTLNEPANMAQAEYCADEGKTYAPGEFKPHCAWTLYLAGHNMLLSHLEMTRVYKNEFQPTQKGIIGIILDGPWIEPYRNLPENQDAAIRAFEFGIGWFGHPIYSPEGDYSTTMKTRLEAMRVLERRATSRLQNFTQDEINDLKNSADFIGCNYYSGSQAIDLPLEKLTDILGTTQEARDSATKHMTGDDWSFINSSASIGTFYTPWTLRELLNYYRTNYGNKPIYITENGYNILATNENLNDQPRIHYLRGHISTIAAAIEDGCNVKAYTVWSLMDDFEWSHGYTQTYGLYYTNFTDPNRTRTPKASSEFYRNVIANRYIDGF